MNGVLALVLFAAGVQVNFNIAAVGTLLAAAVAAYTSARLLRANRAKIIAETTDHNTAAIERAAKLWQEDNRALRDQAERDRARIVEVEETNRKLRDRIDTLERREKADRERIVELTALLAARGER